MESVTQFVSSNASLLNTLFFLLVAVLVLYVAVTYLYPGTSPTYTRFLGADVDARRLVKLDERYTPAIYTGGDFTLSFWMYVDDWNYRAGKYKYVFSLKPAQLYGRAHSSLVGVLMPQTNAMKIRAHTVKGDEEGPDITDEETLKTLMNGGGSFGVSESYNAPCDINEVPLQRWVCVTIVSSGRVLDVYMNGKLSRSCVLKNVLEVPRGQMTLSLGEHGGFGGRYSSVQMWNQQLTPDVIYGIYQMGPTQVTSNIFTDLAKFLGINVRFTGPDPPNMEANRESCAAQDMIEKPDWMNNIQQLKSDFIGLRF
uniref:Lectin/glucanase superfamily protein n=1 Tax=viral metagenome TaxID=1070528 RepID=A0A6C0E7V4_9ZZZZ